MERPLILVTNDDGMFAPGIRQLVSIVREIGEVIVVAPDAPQSGQGHAITLRKPLRINKVDVFDGIEAYECSGTPVDCVKLAKHVILKDRQVDLCVSGINHGSNASINIIYSGTMSAAMEASLEGVASIGFSFLDFSFEADFSYCTTYVRHICTFVLAGNLKKTLLNVNIPAGPIEGIRVCRQAEARWVEEFKEGKDPRGETYYWLTGRFENLDSGEDADVLALENGYISIVPSHHDLTDYSGFKNIEGLHNVSLIHEESTSATKVG